MVLGGSIALAFGGKHVQDGRARQFASILELLDELLQVVAVHRADVAETQILEQDTGRKQSFDRLLNAPRHREQHPTEAGQPLDVILNIRAETVVTLVDDDVGEVFIYRADRRGYRHLIIVDDNQEVGLLMMPRDVKPLHRRATG